MYALIVVPSVLVIGTVLAVFVNQKIKGVQVFRLIYFSPQVVTMTVVAVIWAFIFSSKSSGLLNSFLGLLHIAPQKWLQDQHLALPCLAIMYIWQNLGMQMLIILMVCSTFPKNYMRLPKLMDVPPLRNLFILRYPD